MDIIGNKMEQGIKNSFNNLNDYILENKLAYLRCENKEILEKCWALRAENVTLENAKKELMEKIIELETINELLKDKIIDLENDLYYHPPCNGGEGYKQSKQNFEELKEKIQIN